MPKFYVQSGSLRSVIDSEDSERAALWCVHTAMECVMPFEDSSLDDGGQCENLLSVDEMTCTPCRLGTTIRVSEIGLDREDAQVFETKEVFQHWYEIVQAIEHLSALM